MTKGCKIWLWILLIGGGISVLSGLAALSVSAGLGFFTIIVGGAQIAGIALMLFKQKKEGFYIQCAASVISFLLNVTHNVNPVFSIIAAAVAPAVTYYLVFIKNSLTGGTTTPPVFGASVNNHSATGTTASATENTSNKTAASAERSDSSAAADYSYDTSSNSATYSAAQTSSSNKANFESTAGTTGNKTVFGAGKNIDVTVDLYKELEIDRSWDEKSIREHLKGLQKLWTQRQGATNDKEQLLLIDKILKFVEDGYRYLTKALKRQQYDAALELAYKAGKIVDEVEEKLHNILDQARAYYRKGKIQLATKLAQEAVDGKVNDPSAYDLLARCYYDTNAYEKAINVVDQGLSIFGDNIALHWLGARIATAGTKNFEDAQRRVNNLISIAPDKAIGHSEQVYLHLRKGDEALAFQEIDSYIAAHPSDDDFKRGVAYDLDVYSNTCYYYDAAQNATFIADKASYDKCLRLRSKAVEIFSDEHTQNQLESAKYYGQKKWNDWNVDSIKTLAIYGSIFVGLDLIAHSGAFMGLGFVLYAIMGVLIYFSFRPYWQINKTYVTGKMGTIETIVNQVGDISAKIAVWMLRALIQIIGWIFKFVFGLISGRWF